MKASLETVEKKEKARIMEKMVVSMLVAGKVANLMDMDRCITQQGIFLYY